MIAELLVGGVIGYFLGRKDWKQIADEATELAGKTLLLIEAYKERLEEYENERN